MKTSSSFGVSFYLRKNREVNGKIQIYARISVDAKRADFSIKQWIEEKKLVQKKAQPRTMKNYGTTQKYLQSFLKNKFRTDDIFLSQISYKFVIDFEHYLRTTTGFLMRKCCS